VVVLAVSLHKERGKELSETPELKWRRTRPVGPRSEQLSFGEEATMEGRGSGRER
jgi:hypothetical protein